MLRQHALPAEVQAEALARAPRRVEQQVMQADRIETGDQQVFRSVLVGGGGVQRDGHPIPAALQTVIRDLRPSLLHTQENRGIRVFRLRAAHFHPAPLLALHGKTVGPRAALRLYGDIAVGADGDQPHVLLAARLHQADLQAPKPLRVRAPAVRQRQRHIAAAAQRQRLIPKRRHRADAGELPRQRPGQLRVRVGFVALYAVRRLDLEPETQHILRALPEVQQQSAFLLAAEFKGLEHRFAREHLRDVDRSFPLGELDRHPLQRAAALRDLFRQFEHDALGRLERREDRARRRLRRDLQCALRRALRADVGPRQLQQLADQLRSDPVHFILLCLFEPCHQLQDRDAGVVGVVVRPDRAEPRQTALRLPHDILKGLIVQISR